MHLRFITITAVIAAFFCVALGSFVFAKDPKRPANRWFLMWHLALAIWNLSEMVVVIPQHSVAILVYRYCYVAGCFIAYSFLLFMWEIIEYKSERASWVVMRLAIILAILSPTSLLIRDITIDWTDSTPITEVHGPLYIVFAIFYLCTMLYSLLPIITHYRAASASKKNQFRFVILAILVAVLGLIDFFINQAVDSFPPAYYLLEMVISAIFAYAILVHRLMNISVIVRKTLIYSSVMIPLASIYIVIVSLVAHLFEGLAGYQTFFSSAVAAALVTIFFQPLRKRVQTFIDTKFFRQYVDREEKLYELSRDVITHTTPEAMGRALQQVLMETFHPKSGALYVRSRDGSGFSPATFWGGVPADAMSDDNPMVRYFLDHPQPFLQELSGGSGMPQSTRNAEARGRNP